MENKCLWCGEIITRKVNHGRAPKCCDKYHYYKWYYQQNKERLYKNRREWHKKHYIPHPIPRKYATKEEAYEALRQQCKEHYHNNKEYYKQKNREWYERNKDNPDVKRRHALAMKKYNAKRKALKGGEK